MKDFERWLGAEVKVNAQKIVLKFQDEKHYEAIIDNYDCEAIEEFLTVRMTTQEFEALLQVYMGNIADWR